MDHFYHHLMSGGVDKADALRAAQADTRATYERPIDWAGFILTGDWL
jgi:CHAT domain-containing protein